MEESAFNALADIELDRIERPPAPHCGIGFELGVLLPLLGVWARRQGRFGAASGGRPAQSARSGA